MSFYIVFGSIKRPSDFMGGKRLDWGQPPIGVYEAATAGDACQAAASDAGSMATYFAVEGTPWGVDLNPAPARQLGSVASPMERIADHLTSINRLEDQRRELEAIKQHEDRHERLTPAERVARAEAVSAEMEREAGIGPDAIDPDDE